jgi:hypothetical protein
MIVCAIAPGFRMVTLIEIAKRGKVYSESGDSTIYRWKRISLGAEQRKRIIPVLAKPHIVVRFLDEKKIFHSARNVIQSEKNEHYSATKKFFGRNPEFLPAFLLYSMSHVHDVCPVVKTLQKQGGNAV